ncbi:Ig-like domain repeat protein, partial [uncultured Flavobacterium sp.]|uniref:Ig-like domain repeat protein n=1 Tax=uncultured Flavobacterium sp. TaxID=165435 RepID=UPI0030EF454D
MKTFLPKSGLLTLVFLITNLFFASGAFAQATIENAPAGAVTGTTTIETDKQDYPPGGEVIISGRGYLPNEKVWLQIVHEGEDPNGIDEPNHQPFLVQADGGGVIEGVIWIVPTNGDSLGATFILSATSSVRGDGSFTYAGWKFTDKDNTSVSLTSSTNPSSLGTTVTFTATVNGTSAGGVPAGSIDFKDGNTVLASNVAFSSTTSNKSTATFTTSTLVVGTHIITAKYGAIGSVYNSSTSTELNQVVTSPCTSPIIYTVTGGGAYCSGGAGLAVGLSNSETGVSYHLYKDAIITGSAVLGTSGSSISFGTQTVVGTYTVVATRVDGSCTSNMTGNAIISTNPLPSAPGANNYNAPYDGTSHSATATAPSGSTVVYYDASSAGNVISAPTGTNAGPTITAYAESVSASGCKSTSRTPVTLAITKRSLEITASSDTKVYDGTALTNLGFTITGSGTLASGQTLSAVTVIGSQTAFGSSNNVASAAVIKNAALVDVTSNYDVSYVNGTLAITKRSLEITASSDTK